MKTYHEMKDSAVEDLIHSILTVLVQLQHHTQGFHCLAVPLKHHTQTGQHYPRLSINHPFHGSSDKTGILLNSLCRQTLGSERRAAQKLSIDFFLIFTTDYKR